MSLCTLVNWKLCTLTFHVLYLPLFYSPLYPPYSYPPHFCLSQLSSPASQALKTRTQASKRAVKSTTKISKAAIPSDFALRLAYRRVKIPEWAYAGNACFF